MRGLSMVHSYSTLALVCWCVWYGFSEFWLIPILVLNAVLSLVLALHINSRRGRCTVPVEGELVLSEVREIADPPTYHRRRIQWVHDVWRYHWGSDVCFVEDTIPPLMCFFGPLVGIKRSGTLWVDPSRSPYASYGGALTPDWGYHLCFYCATAVLSLLLAAITAATCAGGPS